MKKFMYYTTRENKDIDAWIEQAKTEQKTFIDKVQTFSYFQLDFIYNIYT